MTEQEKLKDAAHTCLGSLRGESQRNPTSQHLHNYIILRRYIVGLEAHNKALIAERVPIDNELIIREIGTLESFPTLEHGVHALLKYTNDLAVYMANQKIADLNKIVEMQEQVSVLAEKQIKSGNEALKIALEMVATLKSQVKYMQVNTCPITGENLDTKA